MSLDHEDTQRIGTIERGMDDFAKILSDLESLYKVGQKENILQNKMNQIIKDNTDSVIEEVNRLHNRVCDIEKAVITIEERLSMMDELKKEKIKDMNQQVDSMIDQLPMGVKGMMKKILKGTTPEELENEKGDEKNA